MPEPASLLIILILCISGYYMLNKIHRYHFSLKRSDGYHTFLISMTAGLTVCGISLVAYTITDWILCSSNLYMSLGSFVLNSILSFEADTKTIAMFDLCSITIFICITFPLCLYKFDMDHQQSCFLEEFSQDSESPEFTQLFFKSLKFGLPILFTMSDRKVYIGYPNNINAKPFNDVHIIPLISGYRESETNRLIQITPYIDIINDIEDVSTDSVKFDSYTVTLPIREIVHAHLHDFQKYNQFLEAEKNYDCSQPCNNTTQEKVLDHVRGNGCSN